MLIATLLRPALATTVLAAVTACGASSMPDVSASATTRSPAADTRPSAESDPVAATIAMPDVIGGNAGRAFEQMNSELDMVFEDASGQGRAVDDPAVWKICDSRPGPNQQITEFPVVFEVVEVSESCEDTTSK